MTLEQIERMTATGSVVRHHEAASRGYVGTKQGPKVYGYSGRFGTGWEVHYPNREGFCSRRRPSQGLKHSNNFHRVVYYIIQEY